MSRRGAIALFLIPSALVMGLIVLWPFVYNLWLSMTNLGLYTIKDGPDFVGFAQYLRLFGEPDLYEYLLRTLIWTGINVVFHVVIGVGLALALNQKFTGRAFYRGLLILPWALPQYIAALSWRGMFNFEYGQINLLLGSIGMDPVPWLSTEVGAFAAALITNIWLGFPFMMVVALGGLQSIPKEMYEAADIDGAGSWWRLRHITIPLLRPVMMPAIVLGTIWTFNNLNVIWLVTNHGEPADSSHILVTYVYKAAFVYYRYGYAAAFGVLIFLILLVLTWMNYRQADKSAYGA